MQELEKEVGAMEVSEEGDEEENVEGMGKKHPDAWGIDGNVEWDDLGDIERIEERF